MVIDIMSFQVNITLEWMLEDLIDGKSMSLCIISSILPMKIANHSQYCLFSAKEA